MLRARSSLSARPASRRAPATHSPAFRRDINTNINFTSSSRNFYSSRFLFSEKEISTQHKKTINNTFNHDNNLKEYQQQQQQNFNDAPNIITSSHSERKTETQKQQLTQTRYKGYILLLISFMLILSAILILINREEDEEELDTQKALERGINTETSLLTKLNNDDNNNNKKNNNNSITESNNTLINKPSGVLQTMVNTLKENMQVQAEQDNSDANNKEEALRQAEESMPGQSVETEDVRELQNSLLESQQEVTELRQHIRRLRSQMSEQQKDSQNELENQLEQQTQKHLQELDDALEKKEQEHRRTVESLQSQYERLTEEEVSRQVTAKEDELMQFFAKKGKERLDKIEELNTIVDTIENAWNSQGEFLQHSHKVHKLETAVNCLDAVIKKPSSPFHPQLQELAEVGQNDDVVNSVLDSFGDSLPNQGAPSMQELRGQFNHVARDVKSAAYAPSDTGFLGSVFGKAAAYLTVPEKGLVDGDGADSVIARAEFFLNHDNLSKAVNEMDQLQGDAATASKPWVDQAKQRLTLEQNVKFLKAHTHDIHSSLSQN